MSESDAEYYQRHKDDKAEWGEPVRSPASARRRLASMISVRFSPDEARSVRAAAADAGESVSNFIRTAALRRSLRIAPTPTVSGTRESVAWAHHPPVTSGTPDDEATWKPDPPLAASSTS